MQHYKIQVIDNVALPCCGQDGVSNIILEYYFDSLEAAQYYYNDNCIKYNRAYQLGQYLTLPIKVDINNAPSDTNL